MTLFGEPTHRDVSQKFSLLFHSLAMDVVVYVCREEVGVPKILGARVYVCREEVGVPKILGASFSSDEIF